MTVIAIPTRSTGPRDERFAQAHLLFPGGMNEFDSDTVLAWIGKERSDG